MKKRKMKFAETADAYLLAGHLALIALAADASVWADPALIIFVLLFSCCMLISWHKASCRVFDRTYTRAKALRLACLAPAAALLAVCAHPLLGFWPLAAFALACASACLAYLCTQISYLRRKLSDKKLLPQSDSHAQTDSPHVLLASKDRRLPCERHSWWQLPHWLPWLSPKSLS